MKAFILIFALFSMHLNAMVLYMNMGETTEIVDSSSSSILINGAFTTGLMACALKIAPLVIGKYYAYEKCCGFSLDLEDSAEYEMCGKAMASMFALGLTDLILFGAGCACAALTYENIVDICLKIKNTR